MLHAGPATFRPAVRSAIPPRMPPMLNDTTKPSVGSPVRLQELRIEIRDRVAYGQHSAHEQEAMKRNWQQLALEELCRRRIRIVRAACLRCR